ncbi:peptidase M56 [Paenibacillus sp. 598K]|uniref:M56 family metallopeptidase n=1 Tax=Paenibacillus sp. 598K TaxID=1117987 RepID=UPI000FF97810|nr:M56 family metallopeptidase [Paenibacillus sp. 598K]GBF73805.1 peptidase M56 [Paenibacillus sp. 598K]
MSAIETVFVSVLRLSLTAAVVVGLLLCLRRWLPGMRSPKLLHLLWILVLAKLLIPLPLTSPISIEWLLPPSLTAIWQLDAPTSGQHVSSVQLPDAEGIEAGNDDGAAATGHNEQAAGRDGQAAAGSEAEAATGRGAEASAGVAGELPAGRSQPAASRSELPSAEDGSSLADRATLQTVDRWLAALAIVWLSGAVLLALGFVAVARRSERRWRSARRIDSPQALSVLQDCQRRLGIRRAIPLYAVDGPASPWIGGLLRPRIYLPEALVAQATPEALTHVLLHELLHYRRRDLWLGGLWMAALCLHWFNPLVWLGQRAMNADRELACDAAVLEALGEREAAAYGSTLLLLARFGSEPGVLLAPRSYFLHTPSQMKRRIVMITQYKSGGYRLSILALLAVVVLGVVLLTQARNGSEPSVPVAEEARPEAQHVRIDRPIPTFRWFASLDRAQDFAPYTFKVPDTLPTGYRFVGATFNENFSKAEKADLIELVTMTFKSEKAMTDIDSLQIDIERGPGSLLEHNLLNGARTSTSSDLQPAYRQEDLVLGERQGVRYTSDLGHSFVWDEGDLTYAIDYDPAAISEAELAEMIASFVLPAQASGVDYKGEGNSIPLYDDTDLRQAATLLGFPVKVPYTLSDHGLTLIDAMMHQPDAWNTELYIHAPAAALVTTYRVTGRSDIYEINDTLEVYQSREVAVDTSKLESLGRLDIDGIQIAIYEDREHQYWPAIPLDRDRHQFKSQTYYVWQQDGVYYTVFFLGLDAHREDTLRALMRSALYSADMA